MGTPKIVIGITGRVRAGKETTAHLFSQCVKAEVLSSSDSLYETLRLFDIPLKRQSPQTLSTFLRSAYGVAVLECAIIKKIESSSNTIFVVTSLRRESDFFELKRKYQFYLVFIDAPIARRYERFMGELKDQQDIGMTPEVFRVRDDAEAESQIDDLKTISDFVIENTGSKEELEKKIDLVGAAIINKSAIQK